MANYQIKLVLRPELVLSSSSYSKSKVAHCFFFEENIDNQNISDLTKRNFLQSTAL